MIKRIVSFSLYQPLFIVLGVALFIGGGIWAFKNLPVEAFPDVTDTQVTVISLFPGRAAEEVEKQITIPLEVGLSGLPGAVRMFSHTQFGLSFIILTFDDRYSGYFARQQVVERLREVDMPEGAQAQLAPFSTAIGEIYRYRMKGDKVSPRELRTYQDWVVSRQLRLVPGVADVVTLGGLVKQYEVRPDPARMRDYKVTLAQLSQAIQRGNANAGGSYVEQGRQQFLIRGIGLFTGPEDIGNVVVAERSGTPILVKDIARVAVGAVPRQGVAGQDDDDDVVTGVVLMRRGENPSEVLKAVRAKIGEVNDTGLPAGVKVVPIYDRTWLIGKTLTTVFTNLVEGALLVSTVLWMFLGNLRAAAIVALTIPLALLATFLGLSFLGIPANLLSLGAMDFGIIVDGAVILSLTRVPLLSAVMLKKNLPEQENFLVRGAKLLYEPALGWALGHRRFVLGAAVISLALSLALLPRLGTEFLPELNEGAVWVNVNYPTSVSVTEAQELSRRVRQAIRKFPEVVSVTSKAGRPEDGTDPKLINMAEFLVDLKPENEWQRGVDKPRLLREMDAEVNKIPGITPSFSQPIRDNVLESISQIDGQIVIKVFGDDLEVLRDQSLAVLRQVETVPGVARAFVDRLGELPQIQGRVDRARAARYGLNVSDIQDVIETGLGGKQVTQMWEGEQHFGVAVRLDEPERTLVRMQSLLVATSAGAYVPLSEVANFRTVGGLMNIARENGKRVFAIGVFICGRDMGGVGADMKSRVAQHLKLPPGYSITWSGEFENQERAMARLAVIVPISILVIFLLLFDAFNSFRSSLLIVANIPFSVIGGIVALWITGIYLSVSAAIGFIGLLGQSVLNGVVMVALFNELREGGMAPEEAVVSGAITRLRTVLMPALLASLGLLPMALSTGIGAETQKPLAVVVIGGLVSATLLVLFVLPVIYVMLYRREERTTV